MQVPDQKNSHHRYPTRRRWGIALILILPAFSAGSAHAGLYNPAEPEEAALNLKDFQRFRQTMDGLRFLAAAEVKFEYPLRSRYVLASRVNASGLPQSLTVSERISLSAYYLRTQKYREAQAVLAPLIRDEQNFIALSNYAASQQADRVDQAIAYAKRAIKAWPKWSDLSDEQRQLVRQLGWDEERFALCKTAEGYYVKLLELRRSKPLKRAIDKEGLDALFADDTGPLRFIGESGKYEAGKLAARERQKLP